MIFNHYGIRFLKNNLNFPFNNTNFGNQSPIIIKSILLLGKYNINVFYFLIFIEYKNCVFNILS